ncbi:MAG: Rne/Rng family ribonuclease, partial [Leptolyngbyaceae cyanobacterium bins.59]|nr:Rne/Rng family ribonuclease [Leptolyngbyaceae cyanobacterium bins.59]
FVNIGDSERNGFIHADDLGPLRLKRSGGSITELLSPQQKVLVQVMKEPTGNKGPRLTGKITLPGRYLVLMPFGRGVNLSRHIRSENERNRLRALAILIKPAGMGMIVRTEAEGVAEEAIIEDLETLLRQWETVQQEAATSRAPALLNRDDDFIQRVLRDMYTGDVNRIVVDSHTGLKRVKQHLMNWSGGRTPQGVLVDHHRERAPILEYFRVNAAIREAMKPRVDLPSGGYIIIEPTEALTVVDVNSGSFTRSATARETVLWTNCEAAVEIARQLRLRNLAGVIIVDFIDMDQRRDQLQVLEQFNKALRADKARPQIAQLTELGLVELTRKRQGQNIYELFGRSCPTCGGMGHLVHLPGEMAREESVDDPDALPSREYAGAETAVRGRVESPGYAPESVYGRRGRGPGQDGGGRSRHRSRDVSSRDAVPYDPAVAFAPPVPAQPEAPWQAPPEESLDLEEGDEALDTEMGYGGYADRGGAGNRRRRRRRDGKPGSEGRPEAPWTGKRGRGEGYGNGVTIDEHSPDTLPPREGIRPRESARPELSEPEGYPIPEEVTNREGWSSRRGERSKPSRREGGKPSAPPLEVITVEMTPEEQDVYSWMGVSPLVMVEREVDPKSAMVAVVLPGEKPVLPVVEQLEFTEPSTSEASEPYFLEEPSAISPEPEVFAARDLPVVEVEADPEPSPSEPVTRRRRRRSSATDGE